MKKSNSIIIKAVNGLTTDDAIVNIKKWMEDNEKSAFNIAMFSAYATGVTIPAYTDKSGNEYGDANVEKAIKQAELIDKIGRAKSTLSRWIKAMRVIIANNHFADFANGVLPFSFDKIILIDEHQSSFAGFDYYDLFSKSVKELEKMIDAEDDADADDVAVEVEFVSFVYNDVSYTVDRDKFEKWLEKNAKTE